LLAGALQCDLSASDAPVSWRIIGHGRSPVDGGTSLDVKASGLPLIQLRPVLPFARPARAGTAVQLDGSAGFTLAVDANPDTWTASGKVEAANVSVAWQGASWRAAHVSMGLARVGTGVPIQALSQLQVTGWQYQGALQSLTATANPAAGEGRAALPWRSDIDWRIDAMDWQGGTVSFGRADAVWARDVELQLQGWRKGQLATVTLAGDVDGGQLQAAGHIGRIDGMLHTDIKGRVSSARPFFLNAWLQISGAPRVIRGRWASRFSWQTDAHGLGHGRLRLWLHRWQLETGAFPHDPFLGRTGFAAHDLLHRLQAERLAVINVDDVQTRPDFSWANLGDAMLSRLEKQANAAAAEVKDSTPSRLRAETRIRLHGKAVLSHNERVRLRKLWRRLISDRHLVIDMVPQMERQDLDADLVATIRHTQDMIARFMTERGIPPRRLFPVWPTRADRGRGSLGVRVEVRQP
jgi:GNAT superfamily N-acetyltransferase